MSLEKNLNTAEQLNISDELAKVDQVWPNEAYDASLEDGKEKDAKTLAGELLQSISTDKWLSIELPPVVVKDLKDYLSKLSSTSNPFEQAMAIMTLKVISRKVSWSLAKVDYWSMMQSSGIVLDRLSNIIQQLPQVASKVTTSGGHNILVNYKKALDLWIAYNKMNPDNKKPYAENYAFLLSNRNAILSNLGQEVDAEIVSANKKLPILDKEIANLQNKIKQEIQTPWSTLSDKDKLAFEKMQKANTPESIANSKSILMNHKRDLELNLSNIKEERGSILWYIAKWAWQERVKGEVVLWKLDATLESNSIKDTPYELPKYRDGNWLTDTWTSKLNQINQDPDKSSDRGMSIWSTILSYKRDNPKVPNDLVFALAEAKYNDSQEHTIATTDAYKKAKEAIETFKQQQSQPQKAPEVIASISPTP